MDLRQLLNVQTAYEDDPRMKEAYRGDHLDRLASVKATYDPNNLVRVNQLLSGCPIDGGGCAPQRELNGRRRTAR